AYTGTPWTVRGAAARAIHRAPPRCTRPRRPLGVSRRATASPRRDERWGCRGAPRFRRGATSAGGVEARHGFAGARRALGVSRRATALPGCDERRGVWGAISGPPMYLDRVDRGDGGDEPLLMRHRE